MAEPETRPTVIKEPQFQERPTEFIVKDAFVLGAIPLALAGLTGLTGWTTLGGIFMALTVFVACFFRNPPRLLPGDERTVVAPADGRVLEAGEIELADGSKGVQVAIFLSVFNVHVNRTPVAGRVLSIDRSGEKYLAAFNRAAEQENVRCDMVLETENGERVVVTQITGLIARRIVCHASEGGTLERGEPYGLICYGSRAEVYLPLRSEIAVRPGDRVRGGATILAEVPA